MSQKLALIIGNSEYEDTKLLRLKTPGVDVSNLAELLRAPDIGGFNEVTPLINQTSAMIRRAIARLFAEKSPEDLLLLFFSGHGIRDDNGDLHLAVRDTESNLLSATAIPAAFITAEMDRSRSRRQILILDCCHSGAFARGTKGTSGLSVGTAAAFQGTGYGRVVLTASDSTQYAWEGDQVIGQAENSVFTHYLVQGLKTGKADTDADGRITLDELYDYVYEQVVNKTPKQTPGKWAYKQQGEIVIARNPRPVVKPAELPAELLNAIESPLSSVREGVVRELDRLLHGNHKGLALAAYLALERLKDDDSRRVSVAATAILTIYAETQRAAGEKIESARVKVGPSTEYLLKEEVERRRRTLEKTAAEQQAKAEAERKAKVDTKRPVINNTETAHIAPEKAAAEQQTTEKVKAEPIVGERTLARPVKTIAWWLLGLSILFALLTFGVGIGIIGIGIGIIGIVGSIGMLKRRKWGRHVGLIFTLLLEVAGLAGAVAIVSNLSINSVSSGQEFDFWIGAVAALVSLSIGIILSSRLCHESVVLGLGANVKRPAGILPIAIPMLLTVFGTIPALGLLRNRNRGRRGMMVFLGLFMFASIIGAIGAGSAMRRGYYSSFYNSYNYMPNDWGRAIAIIAAIVVVIWCGIAFFYLRSSRVKIWFQNGA